MDCAPLNLAHFHERRANKFMRHHSYDEAYKAVETSLLYLQKARKIVTIPKSIEVLNTQKWDYERKLRQIQMRKLQYERMKIKEIVPLAETNSVLMRPENSVTAQSVAKSIDKTIEDFDAKFGITLEQNMCCLHLNNENEETKTLDSIDAEANLKQNNLTISEQLQSDIKKQLKECAGEIDEMPTLAPLELPSFDFNMFSSSTPSLVSLSDLVYDTQN